MADLPVDDEREQTEVRDGYFEREISLSREDAARFLEELADQVGDGHSLTVESEEWRIPFEFDEPIEIEVEYSEGDGTELEIEIEFDERRSDDTLEIS